MKKMIKMLALVVAILYSTLSYAGHIDDPVEIKVIGEKTFKLVLNDITNGVQIQLTDQDGYLLHTEIVQGATAYAKLYNLSALPDGQYFMEMDYPTKINVIPVLIKADKVVLQPSKAKEFFKPVIRQKGASLSIMQFAPHGDPLRIYVYDQERLLFRDKLEGKLDLGRQYDLSRLDPGSYQINLASDGRTFKQTISIE